MPPESLIPTAASQGRPFAVRLGLFYSASFAVLGTHLPFFTVWLKAIGIDPAWIGIIGAVAAVTRFTTLPLVTGLAERRQALRAAMILTAFAACLGFATLGTQHQPWPLLLLYIMTCCFWTPLVPLTDAYALRGVARYGLKYGPLRLWGSAAFAIGALRGLLCRRRRSCERDDLNLIGCRLCPYWRAGLLRHGRDGRRRRAPDLVRPTPVVGSPPEQRIRRIDETIIIAQTMVAVARQ